MTLGLAHASDSSLEWQAVKLTFFAPCMIYFYPSWVISGQVILGVKIIFFKHVTFMNG